MAPNTIRPIRTALLLAAVVLSVSAAKPHPTGGASATTIVGSKKLATAADCSQPIAFSGTHVMLDNDKQVVPTKFLLDQGVGYAASTGIFTTHCPGLYSFSFAGYPTTSGKGSLLLELKRRAISTESWTSVVSVGPLGGSNTVLLRMAVGDQVAVFSSLKDLDGATFSGYRFAKE
ncbi:uncharacterized protein LOC106645362 [Copidosoma floridanum]|uniref:uncharacterized protein LOC106645362 n=1 Tax=Copidosoma floridanum TaxID=29053 RepID=UPI0006C9D593|nr:uncharacterized protein LOC106645362 [Copidosoma floridanum]